MPATPPVPKSGNPPEYHILPKFGSIRYFPALWVGDIVADMELGTATGFQEESPNLYEKEL